jgi:hypothetical protein
MRVRTRDLTSLPERPAASDPGPDRRSRLGLLAAWLLCSILAATGAFADAIVRSQAMFATTIAEYFIEEDRVRLELEIGISDLEAFRNLLPDEIYGRLGFEARPYAERLAEFVAKDLVILGPDGEPLRGRLLDIGPRPRLKRDEISGEPLPAGEEEPETVVAATLEYVFEGRPETLTLGGPQMQPIPSVGYVAYHGNVAVNDFRYLTPTQTLVLDWEDPWYTAFDTRALRRTYFAPMSGFIYVEPYEVRKEIIVRPLDLQRWVDLGLEGRSTIPVDIQPELLRRAAEFLRERQRVVIDGATPAPELARINFLERTLRTSRVIDPPVELDVYSATIGVIFVYPTAGLPDKVTMDWDLFDERVQLVPASSVDQAGPLPTYLEPDVPVLEWQNFLQDPVLPTLIEIRPPPTAMQALLLSLRWVLLPAALLWIAWLIVGGLRGRGVDRAQVLAAVALLLVTGWSFRSGGQAGLDDQAGAEVVQGLLTNVYRAFDFRAEERVYDTLARSVSGDLLETIFLETRRSLELENQGGARAKVKDVELVEVEFRDGEDGGFVADARWNVHGSVGHWGHVHTRSNAYQALLNVTPEDGVWKLTGVEILDEQRL